MQFQPCMGQEAPGSPPFEGFVQHDRPAAACNCCRFYPSVRTGLSECDHPSQHLTHGTVGVRKLRKVLTGLGIPVWRWADTQLTNKRRVVAQGLNVRSAMANERQRLELSFQRSRSLPFGQALAFMRSLHLKSAVAWRAWNSAGARPVNVPSSSDCVHEHVGWQGWSHWLSHSRGKAWAMGDVQQRCHGFNNLPAPGQRLKKRGACRGPCCCSVECQSLDSLSHNAQCEAARAAKK